MSEQAEAAEPQAETAQNAVSQEVSQETSQETQTTEKPEGWNQADFNPEQLKRFNRVYKEMKDYQRESYELRKIAQQQSDAIEELRKNQSTVVNYLQEGDFAKTEQLLKTQRKEAYDRGDLSAVDDINDKLNEIKIQRKLESLKPKEQPKQQPQSFNANEAIDTAVKMGAISVEDAQAYKAWASETDEYGNLKRPWINEADHRNMAAAIEGKAVFSNPNYANRTFGEKLAEIDKRMGIINKNVAGPQVLGSGNLTGGNKNAKVQLTDYQKTLAVRTQFAGKGKSTQEHLDAYRKQIESLKGGRK